MSLNSIVPMGYSRKALRERTEKELRQARAGELAGADKKERTRIEKEIRAELDRRFGKVRWRSFFDPPILW